MKAALPLLVVVVLAFGASAQTYTNLGGNYCTTYLCTTAFHLTDGGTLELGYHMLEIIDGGTYLSCSETSITITWLNGATPAWPKVGDKEILAMSLNCGTQSGVSQQTNEVVAITRCGGRGSHPCPVFQNKGGTTTIQ
jgi:hypothetical protein